MTQPAQTGRAVSVHDAIALYVHDRTSVGRAGETLRRYRSTLRMFEASLPAGDMRLTSVTSEHLDEWLSTMGDVAPGTKRGRVSVVRGFFGWCVRRTELTGLTADPSLWLESPRKQRSVPRALSPDAVRACFAACSNLRDELVLSLMVMEAMRVGEVARLQLGDVDLQAKLLLVHGKGGHERLVPLTDETRRVLMRYLDAYPARGAGPLIRAFTRDGEITSKPIRSQSLTRIVSGICERAGVKAAPFDGVSPHAFRHTALSDVYEGCRDIRLVQELAGHTSMTTTQIYLRHVSHERMASAVGGRSYRQAVST